MPEPIVLWGATGQARVLADFLPGLGYFIESLIDRDPKVESPLAGVPILRGESAFREWVLARGQAPAALAAIGGDRGEDRLAAQQLMESLGCRIVTAVHPRATVSASAQMGRGSQVLAGAVVGPDSELGRGVIVNTRASVDHECRLSDGVHVAPGVTLCGLVQIGKLAFVGAGAVILPRIRIGENSVIGAGSVVTRDVPDNVIAFGNPVRIVRARTPPGNVS
ncbi:MAG: acetyltransferase [Verrucomicrobiae bacterium]|nr:acetyltransferase [Verrucomicrobiae bacterium]